MTATAAYANRQPNCCPSAVPAGTPTMLATVRPRNIIDTARAARSCATSLEATTAPTPNSAPCGSPARTRAANSSSKFGASAEATFPTTNTPVSISSSRLCGTRAPIAVSSGAPTTTPRA